MIRPRPRKARVSEETSTEDLKHHVTTTS
jgi:hypothetical protein